MGVERKQRQPDPAENNGETDQRVAKIAKAEKLTEC